MTIGWERFPYAMVISDSANVTDSGIDSLISEHLHVKMLASLQLPCGMLNLRSIGF